MTKYDETVCYYINRMTDMLEHALKTGDLDVLVMQESLEAVRRSAQNMENGLTLRKKIMEENRLEESYKKLKKEFNTPPGVNKVAQRNERATKATWQKRDYQVIVKENGVVVYDVHSYAGVICNVEQITDMDEQGTITGTTQKFLWGHDLAIWYGFDQLQQSMQTRKVQIMTALTAALQGKKLFTPKLLNMLKEATNKII